MKNIRNFDEWTDTTEHKKLGEILMQAGKLNLIHLGMALDMQRFEDSQLGELLINMKIITQNDLDEALELQSQIDKMLKDGEQ